MAGIHFWDIIADHLPNTYMEFYDGTDQLICLLCTRVIKTFHDIRHLGIHVDQIHGYDLLINRICKFEINSVYPVKCLICLNKYISVFEFSEHAKKWHIEIVTTPEWSITYRCRECGKADQFIYEILEHLATHVPPERAP